MHQKVFIGGRSRRRRWRMASCFYFRVLGFFVGTALVEIKEIRDWGEFGRFFWVSLSRLGLDLFQVSTANYFLQIFAQFVHPHNIAANPFLREIPKKKKRRNAAFDYAAVLLKHCFESSLSSSLISIFSLSSVSSYSISTNSAFSISWLVFFLVIFFFLEVLKF